MGQRPPRHQHVRPPIQRITILQRRTLQRLQLLVLKPIRHQRKRNVGTIHGTRIPIHQRHHSHTNRRSCTRRSPLPSLRPRHRQPATRMGTTRTRNRRIHHLTNARTHTNHQRRSMATPTNHRTTIRNTTHQRSHICRSTHTRIPRRQRTHKIRSSNAHRRRIRRPIRRNITLPLRLLHIPHGTKRHENPTPPLTHRNTRTTPLKSHRRHTPTQHDPRHVATLRLLRLRHHQPTQSPTPPRPMRRTIQTRHTRIRRTRINAPIHRTPIMANQRRSAPQRRNTRRNTQRLLPSLPPQLQLGIRIRHQNRTQLDRIPHPTKPIHQQPILQPIHMERMGTKHQMVNHTRRQTCQRTRRRIISHIQPPRTPTQLPHPTPTLRHPKPRLVPPQLILQTLESHRNRRNKHNRHQPQNHQRPNRTAIHAHLRNLTHSQKIHRKNANKSCTKKKYHLSLHCFKRKSAKQAQVAEW